MKLEKSEITQLSVSDGGEGFLESIEQNISAQKVYQITLNPIFKPLKTYFLIKNTTAYIEYAKTGGLNLIEQKNRNPMKTSSYGMGQQISEAINRGAKNIIIGLGGSATNDAGIGMACALGFKFYNKKKNELKPTGANLINIYDIKTPKNFNKLKKVCFYAATDVENKLFGKKGAAFTFAQQKGASENEIIILDTGLRNLSSVLSKSNNTSIIQENGDGAAGGLGFGIRNFLNGKIISGTNFITDLLNIENMIKQADIIFTGEGKVDKQSFNGKFVGNIYNLTKKHNKQLIVICGKNDLKQKKKIFEIYPLFDSIPDIKTAKNMTPNLIDKIIKQIFIFK